MVTCIKKFSLSNVWHYGITGNKLLPTDVKWSSDPTDQEN